MGRRERMWGRQDFVDWGAFALMCRKCCCRWFGLDVHVFDGHADFLSGVFYLKNSKTTKCAMQREYSGEPNGVGGKNGCASRNFGMHYRRVTKQIHIHFKKACFYLCGFKPDA